VAELVISGLRAGVEGKEILKGIDLIVRWRGARRHGPERLGQEHPVARDHGPPGYEVLGGSVTLDGADVLAMDTWERAQAGLFLAMQYPTEVPGVSLEDVLVAAFEAGGRDPAAVPAMVGRGRAHRVRRAVPGARPQRRPVGRREEAQRDPPTRRAGPAIAILDELDSGLDVDALRDCARRVEASHHRDRSRRARHHPLHPAAA
jgi:Fe-S cluster assembly ATP-binding protein